LETKSSAAKKRGKQRSWSNVLDHDDDIAPKAKPIFTQVYIPKQKDRRHFNHARQPVLIQSITDSKHSLTAELKRFKSITKTMMEDGRANNNVQPSLEIVGGPTSEELETALEPLEGGAAGGGVVGGGVVGDADVEAP
jgi:hypothetical protein